MVSRRAGTGTSRLFDEAFVVAHHELRFELAHRVDRHADHDQQRRRAQQQRVHAGNLRRDERQDRDNAQEQRADQCDPVSTRCR